MKMIPGFVRHLVHVYRLRRRFQRSIIHPGVRVAPGCTLGDRSVLFSNVRLSDSSVGAYSYVQENTALYGAEVGPFCSIAANVTIGLQDHPMYMVSTSPVFYDNSQPLPKAFVCESQRGDRVPKTILEADVWIGEGAKVRAGVRIGVGAVIGAGSVVTHDIAPYTIAAGVPCRPLRRRFDDALCNRLLKSAWWLLDEKELIALAHYYSDPIAFLDAIEKTNDFRAVETQVG